MGVLLPVIIWLPSIPKANQDDNIRFNKLYLFLKTFDVHFVKVVLFAIGVYLVSLQGFPLQIYALLSVPFMLLYNGKKGNFPKWFKYFYYAFYPLHIVLLEAICLLILML